MKHRLLIAMSALLVSLSIHAQLYETTESFFSESKTYEYVDYWIVDIMQVYEPTNKHNAYIIANNGTIIIKDGNKIEDRFTKVQIGTYPVFTHKNTTINMNICKCTDKNGKTVYLRATESVENGKTKYNLYRYTMNVNMNKLILTSFYNMKVR